MYSFSYYSTELAPAPETVQVFASEGTSTSSLPHPLGMGSPALSSSDDALSSAGESGIESDFVPYQFCSTDGLDFYDPFDLGFGTLIQDIPDMSSESPSPDIYPASFVEIKTEIDEQAADEEPETECSAHAPNDQFAQLTFGEIKIEEEKLDSGSTIMVPISFSTTGPTERMIMKASRKKSRKGKKIPSTMQVDHAGCSNEASVEFAVDNDSGNSEMESDKSPKSRTPKKRLYEMKREECTTEKQWIQVKRAKNTFNFHEKQRKKLLAAEEIIDALLKLPSVNRALRAKLRGMINEFFPRALKSKL